MLIRNKSLNKNYSLRSGRECFLIRAGQEKEVPERFTKDPAFRAALSSGALVEVAKPAAAQPAPEVTEEQPIEEETPRKARKKQSVMPDA